MVRMGKKRIREQIFWDVITEKERWKTSMSGDDTEGGQCPKQSVKL